MIFLKCTGINLDLAHCFKLATFLDVHYMLHSTVVSIPFMHFLFLLPASLDEQACLLDMLENVTFQTNREVCI